MYAGVRWHSDRNRAPALHGASPHLDGEHPEVVERPRVPGEGSTFHDEVHIRGETKCLYRTLISFCMALVIFKHT